MKNERGFLFFAAVAIFLLCLLLLTASTVAFSRSLSLFQREQQLQEAEQLAQLTAAGASVATNLTVTTNINNHFKEVQVAHGSQILFNLVFYEP